MFGTPPGAIVQDAIIQFIPLTFIGLLWAAPVYLTAQKRRINPWPWTIACVIPVINVIAIPAFWVTTVMSILDRLNKEVGATFE